MLDREEAIELAAHRASVLFDEFGWSYYDGTPNAARLRESIRELFAMLDQSPESDAVGSGRLNVRRTEGGFDISLDLAFVMHEA